jgi:hypothetical protein
MVTQDFLLDATQGCASGRNLCDHVDAIAVLFHHARETTHLTFDPL